MKDRFEWNDKKPLRTIANKYKVSKTVQIVYCNSMN